MAPRQLWGEVLQIDLPRPRDRLALADCPKYNHYRHQVLSFLYEKQRKVEPLPVASAKGQPGQTTHQRGGRVHEGAQSPFNRL